jgi:hypothetical protein
MRKQMRNDVGEAFGRNLRAVRASYEARENNWVDAHRAEILAHQEKYAPHIVAKAKKMAEIYEWRNLYLGY